MIQFTENSLHYRESRLAWNDIYEVIPDSLDSFSLSDRTGDAKVFVSSQVKGYLELVGLIKQKRPDIWKIQGPETFQDTQTFHKNPWSAIQYGLGGMGMMVFSVVAFFDGTGADLFAKAFMFCLGLSLAIMIARQPRKLTFQGSYLIISYYGRWKKNIHINHVKGIFVGQDKIRGALINFIQLKLENGKIITLNGYKEDMPILASAFEKWMKNYSPMLR